MQHQNLKEEANKIWRMKFVNSYKDLMLQVIHLIYLNFLYWNDSNVESSMLTYWYSWFDITTDQQFLITYFNGIKIDSWMWREPLWCSVIAEKSALYATQIPLK
jgi:hypothetical protein